MYKKIVFSKYIVNKINNNIILDYLLKILQYLNKKILKYLKKKKYIIFLLFK